MKNLELTARHFFALTLGVLWYGLADAQQPVARFFYDENENVSRQERDTNNDGRMDRWVFYDGQSRIARIEQDKNFDGKPDITLFYEEGKPKRQEVSEKHDGRVTLWAHL